MDTLNVFRTRIPRAMDYNTVTQCGIRVMRITSSNKATVTERVWPTANGVDNHRDVSVRFIAIDIMNDKLPVKIWVQPR